MYEPTIKPKCKMYEQLNNLYKYYENKYDSVSLSTITPSVFGNDSFYMQLAKRKRQVDSSSRCDISKYLNTDYCSYLSPNEVKKFDIMNWQKSHESTFSVLSKMTRDLLTPPVYCSIEICFLYSYKYNRRQKYNFCSRDARSLDKFEGLGKWTHRTPNFER